MYGVVLGVGGMGDLRYALGVWFFKWFLMPISSYCLDGVDRFDGVLLDFSLAIRGEDGVRYHYDGTDQYPSEIWPVFVNFAGGVGHLKLGLAEWPWLDYGS